MLDKNDAQAADTGRIITIGFFDDLGYNYTAKFGIKKTNTEAPLLLISLIVGLIVSIFQTVTSIQEQTLTFVPKIIAIFLVMMLCGSWMLDTMSGFMTDLWSKFSYYISMG